MGVVGEHLLLYADSTVCGLWCKNANPPSNQNITSVSKTIFQASIVFLYFYNEAIDCQERCKHPDLLDM